MTGIQIDVNYKTRGRNKAATFTAAYRNRVVPADVTVPIRRGRPTYTLTIPTPVNIGNGDTLSFTMKNLDAALAALADYAKKWPALNKAGMA